MDLRTDIDLRRWDWEARQKHAVFFQSQIANTQQAALASYTFTAVLITLGAALAGTPGTADGHSAIILPVSVWIWLCVALLMTALFRKTARRIDRAYREEHVLLFPGAAPYRLESFLLRVRKRS